ncbi:hypothetical protein C7S20_08815 [Christiangramia fulva]|uniref:DUF4230 domain-containing protein n=1 Tax=Christiangramia fulva TaxID=2126553 RepID=A0A2R3Z573_9FLAO|nr:DUF4230 domain-containing protein [Christiangramia fulva]AVR45362.1 hypothetical protein C7S20_08815 [Christiangramia fulva]
MKNFLLAFLFIAVLILSYLYIRERKNDKDSLEENTELIRNQIRNVGKLVVTEGNFTQVFTYKNSKSFYLDILSARKKALIIVNAEASVAYDLSKMETEIDRKNKKVIIKNIPEPELKIDPNIKYYDVTQDYLNQFNAEDYNRIKERIEKGLREKIEKSSLMTNSQNRLISELQKIYILTSSMGWTLEYRNQPIKNVEDFESLKL